MIRLESDWTRAWCKTLEGQGAFVFAVTPSGLQRSGMPDRYIAAPGLQCWVECKRYPNRPKGLQAHTIEVMRSRGVTVLIATWMPAQVSLNSGKRDTLFSYDRFMRDPLEALRCACS